jgi:3-methyladenine DNA glycosylase AlkD
VLYHPDVKKSKRLLLKWIKKSFRFIYFKSYNLLYSIITFLYMADTTDEYDINQLAKGIDKEIRSLAVKNVPNIRAVRRKYSSMLNKSKPEIVLALGRKIFKTYGYRWVAYELIIEHQGAIRKIGEAELEDLGVGLAHWGDVDAFAGYLAGPAWQFGQIDDKLVHKWARSDDRWWRRVALVCTVALNRPTLGGKGDVRRTIAVCKILAGDKDDMVVKAMSWALRELIRHDVNAVLNFLEKYDDVLASRVKREVMNKITTGLKNPKQKKHGDI